MYKRLFLLAALLGTASAHTQITHVTPAQGSRVSAPQNVTLEFSEPINLRFSTFKVYPLPSGVNAEAWAQTKLNLKNDAADRADTYPGASSMAAHLSLPLRPHLKAGTYIVMWRILSDDGHPVSGQATFDVK
ncbi:copper resistance protein CopC [Deinococcus irradiatisoli]|uniref:Copper resistance protein CopC n=1 Tax=Deinococcus irradiatisoli TaxID=2202254 RepID=A0A2Z3JIQ3_9DEIO|nr:copper resistance CopC family protein [Deinococcus irradiatisoli]AWN23250.1 copper resistance protein CopC [Deinococcus irradiatisoli]